MKQYCRYCGYLTVNNFPWCGKREEAISVETAKSPNRCHDFAYNPMDAFGENEKGYIPRKHRKKQCEGQMQLF